MKSTKQLKESLLEKREKQVYSASDLLSSGYTPLNVAATGKVAGAYPKGKYVLIAGTSDSGKTMLGLSALAEAANSPNFDDYRLVYDAPEEFAYHEKAHLFGDKLGERIQPPHGTLDEPQCSETVEDLYDNLYAALAQGPVVWVVDSETALASREEDAEDRKKKSAANKGNKVAGSYSLKKHKYHKKHLRRIIPLLKKTGSILIYITHLIDNIGFGGMFEPHTRPGGTAIKYHARLEIWTYDKGQIKAEYAAGGKKKSKQLGIYMVAKIKKNHLTGKRSAVVVPIYHNTGIDDVGGCVDYLLGEGHWKKSKGVIDAPELDLAMKRNELIKHVEENNLEKKLRLTVKSAWSAIERKVAVHRKSKYS